MWRDPSAAPLLGAVPASAPAFHIPTGLMQTSTPARSPAAFMSGAQTPPPSAAPGVRQPSPNGGYTPMWRQPATSNSAAGLTDAKPQQQQTTSSSAAASWSTPHHAAAHAHRESIDMQKENNFTSAGAAAQPAPAQFTKPPGAVSDTHQPHWRFDAPSGELPSQHHHRRTPLYLQQSGSGSFGAWHTGDSSLEAARIAAEVDNMNHHQFTQPSHAQKERPQFDLLGQPVSHIPLAPPSVHNDSAAPSEINEPQSSIGRSASQVRSAYGSGVGGLQQPEPLRSEGSRLGPAARHPPLHPPAEERGAGAALLNGYLDEQADALRHPAVAAASVADRSRQEEPHLNNSRFRQGAAATSKNQSTASIRGDAAALEGQLMRERSALIELQKTLTQREREASNLKVENARLKERLSASDASNDFLRVQLTAATQKAEKLETQLTTAAGQGELDRLHAQVNQLNATLAEKERELTRVSLHASELRGRLQGMESALLNDNPHGKEIATFVPPVAEARPDPTSEFYHEDEEKVPQPRVLNPNDSEGENKKASSAAKKKAGNVSTPPRAKEGGSANDGSTPLSERDRRRTHAALCDVLSLANYVNESVKALGQVSKKLANAVVAQPADGRAADLFDTRAGTRLLQRIAQGNVEDEATAAARGHRGTEWELIEAVRSKLTKAEVELVRSSAGLLTASLHQGPGADQLIDVAPVSASPRRLRTLRKGDGVATSPSPLPADPAPPSASDAAEEHPVVVTSAEDLTPAASPDYVEVAVPVAVAKPKVQPTASPMEREASVPSTEPYAEPASTTPSPLGVPPPAPTVRTKSAHAAPEPSRAAVASQPAPVPETEATETSPEDDEEAAALHATLYSASTRRSPGPHWQRPLYQAPATGFRTRRQPARQNVVFVGEEGQMAEGQRDAESEDPRLRSASTRSSMSRFGSVASRNSEPKTFVTENDCEVQ